MWNTQLARHLSVNILSILSPSSPALLFLSPLAEARPARAQFWFAGSNSSVLLLSLPVSSVLLLLVWPDKIEMERHFSMEAKAFSFLTKAGKSELRLEERRKGFVGFIVLGY
jgi:hypothetical protein